MKRLTEPVVRRPPPSVAGTVRVSVTVPATPDRVWAALTQQNEVRRWFGELSETIRPGGEYRLDFGDGDFFEIRDVAMSPPTRLSYDWSFLGTGPRNAISWTLDSSAGHCRVTINDAESGRMPASVAEMIEGWTDFLNRLRRYCTTGENARYGWRKEFDAAIELPVAPAEAFACLLSDVGQSGWMPWYKGVIRVGAVLEMSDRLHPERLTVGAVTITAPQLLQFTLGCTEWSAGTECAIRIQPRQQGSLLVVSHRGWQNICLQDDEQAAQRSRFGTLWIQALRKARDLISRSSEKTP